MWLTGLLWAAWSLLLGGGFLWWANRVHHRVVSEQRKREAVALRIAQEAWDLKKAQAAACQTPAVKS